MIKFSKFGKIITKHTSFTVVLAGIGGVIVVKDIPAKKKAEEKGTWF